MPRKETLEQHFARAVSPLQSDLHRRALALTHNAAEADDLVQDTLLRAWQYFRSFEPGTNLRAWLLRIQFTTFVNGYRKQKRAAQLLDDEGMLTALNRAAIGNETSGVPTSNELPDMLLAAVDTLPPIFRQVLREVDLQENSYSETAAKLGCPVGTVMSRLHRARARVRTALAASGIVDAQSFFAA